MTISIPEEVALKLKERAATSGQSVPAYAAQLVIDTVTKPTIDELLAPIRTDFAKSGMTEDELLSFFRGELEAHRQEDSPQSRGDRRENARGMGV
ncbi:MAG TPA: hypothetical protein VIM11_08760 [Tepidisphaeraceae bacterium]